MKLNRTLLRAIDILELLSKSKEGYTLAQLSSRFSQIKYLRYYEDTCLQKHGY